jgi:hypothetical protein
MTQAKQRKPVPHQPPWLLFAVTADVSAPTPSGTGAETSMPSQLRFSSVSALFQHVSLLLRPAVTVRFTQWIMSSFTANIMPTGNDTASASSNVINLGNSETKQLRTKIIALFKPEDCFNADEVMMLPQHVELDRQAQAQWAAASAKKTWKFRSWSNYVFEYKKS